MDRDGLTVVPLRLYFSKGRAKVEIALARGRRLRDQRQELAKREAEREAERAIARKRRR
jgi:SsrA-binding protein